MRLATGIIFAALSGAAVAQGTESSPECGPYAENPMPFNPAEEVAGSWSATMPYQSDQCVIHVAPNRRRDGAALPVGTTTMDCPHQRGVWGRYHIQYDDVSGMCEFVGGVTALAVEVEVEKPRDDLLVIWNSGYDDTLKTLSGITTPDQACDIVANNITPPTYSIDSVEVVEQHPGGALYRGVCVIKSTDPATGIKWTTPDSIAASAYTLEGTYVPPSEALVTTQEDIDSNYEAVLAAEVTQDGLAGGATGVVVIVNGTEIPGMGAVQPVIEAVQYPQPPLQ